MSKLKALLHRATKDKWKVYEKQEDSKKTLATESKWKS